MDSLTREDLLQIVESLLEIATCSICLERVHTNMVQCVNTHLICEHCKKTLTECPICLENFSEDKPTKLTEQMVDALPAQCQYKGCQQIVKPNDDHEQYCGFKVTNCEICTWSGPGNVILDHVEQEHPDCMYDVESEYCYFDEFEHMDVCSASVFISAYNQDLWLKLENNPDCKQFNISIRMVQNGNPKEKLYFKVKFSSKGPKFISRIKIDQDYSKNSIVVPWYTLPAYITENQELRYSIKISNV